MRLFLTLLAAAVLAIPLTACDNPSPAPKIAVVDTTRILRDCAMGQTGMKKIEDLQTKMQKQLDDLQTKLEKNPADEEAMRDLQKIYATSQQQIQAEAENILNQILEAAQGAVDQFRKNNGYAVILRQEAAESFDPALDVTDALLAELNKINIDFKPLPAPAAPASGKAAAPQADKKDEAPDAADKEGGEAKAAGN